MAFFYTDMGVETTRALCTIGLSVKDTTLTSICLSGALEITDRGWAVRHTLYTGGVYS